MIEQLRFTPDQFAAELAGLTADPARLAAMAAAAHREGILDAADRLAEVVMKAAGLDHEWACSP